MSAAHAVRPTLRRVVVRGGPHLIEATLVPTILFYAAWFTIGRWGAFAAALVWAYGALARRIALGHRIPGLLILALLALTARTALAFITGSTFLYFLQPILGTCLVAAVFLGSAATSRPLVARLAADFYPLTDEMAGRHQIRRLFRHLTVFWAGINLLNALAAMTLLLTLPMTGFVAINRAAALLITCAGIAVTVTWSVRVARQEGLIHEQPLAAVVPQLSPCSP